MQWSGFFKPFTQMSNKIEKEICFWDADNYERKKKMCSRSCDQAGVLNMNSV